MKIPERVGYVIPHLELCGVGRIERLHVSGRCCIRDENIPSMVIVTNMSRVIICN